MRPSFRPNYASCLFVHVCPFVPCCLYTNSETARRRETKIGLNFPRVGVISDRYANFYFERSKANVTGRHWVKNFTTPVAAYLAKMFVLTGGELSAGRFRRRHQTRPNHCMGVVYSKTAGLRRLQLQTPFIASIL